MEGHVMVFEFYPTANGEPLKNIKQEEHDHI